MTRTNIDIDDDLVATVMEQNDLKTKREAVEFALRKTVRKPMTYKDLLKYRGIGYALSNEEIEEAS
ncbi:type II toxin-antitoxin system VapB family antitoxin [Microlunatus parietis]|uniref:Arc/MetJ family transcription regulator n=1 Tax=Microlunatus parietis TaxID=682979 RepID=A0A7Y9I2S6_9ACTN|nr:type II toxin-antitoxin system VapB family antitoxin [Microlunatus parietis]NYE69185.1 Arc/MetJ family transcription regulator [Microlunatus parietis]